MGVISDAIDALEDWCCDLFKDGIKSQFDGISNLLTDTFSQTTGSGGLVSTYLTSHPANFTGGGTGGTTLIYVTLILSMVINTNLYLAVFNLLPIPPFDGSRFFGLLLPERIYWSIMKYEQYISLAIMMLLFFGVLSPILSTVTGWLMNLIFFVFTL